MKWTVLVHWPVFPIWPRVFCCALGCGARFPHVWGPVGLRGSRPRRSKSGELASTNGIAFRLAEPRRTMETPQFNGFALLLCHVCIASSIKLSSSLLCCSHGTTAVAHQALPFVTAMDGASVCVLVWAMFPVYLGNRNEHNIPREAQ